MLFKKRHLDGIAEGKVTVAFRRWSRPTVKSGGTLNSPVGLLHIKSVTIITGDQISPRSAEEAGFESVSDLFASLMGRNGELYRIEFKRVGEDPRIALRKNDTLTDEDVLFLNGRLERLDAHSNVGPWTLTVLKLINANPELRAGDLAHRSGFGKEWLKLNIRKLKNLGLTESLEVGYRLSPRGAAYLKTVEKP